MIFFIVLNSSVIIILHVPVYVFAVCIFQCIILHIAHALHDRILDYRLIFCHV